MLKLEKKIGNKSAKIDIVGLSYIGLPLAVALSEVSFNDPDLIHIIQESINSEGLSVLFMLKPHIWNISCVITSMSINLLS